MLVLVFLGPAASATARPKPDEPRGGRACNALSVEGTESGQIRAIREYSPGWAASHVRRLGRNAAFWITLHGRISCAEFRDQLAAVLLAKDELVALQSRGWRIGRVIRMRVDGVAVHRVSASKRNGRISYVRPGGAAPVDGAAYRAGQTLGFDRTQKTCTSAFVLRLADGRVAGLSAGHCSDGPAWAPPQYPGGPPIYVTDNVLRDRGTLGPVLQNMNLQEQGPDALVFALDGAPSATQQIDRGRRTPHRVTGVLPLRGQREGRTVCFTGHTSGIDRCGRIDGDSTWFGRRVTCVRAPGKLSDHGDSGGPVYTRPVGGRVKAVGIVSRSSVGGGLRDMCYTPIQAILEGFGAELG
jgi:hypothetical protein